MIFNRKYDRTLWLMSLSKRSNEILGFMNRIPQEFLVEVQDAIKMSRYYEVEQKEVKDNKNWELNGVHFNSNDTKYWYSLDLVTGALNLGESVLYEGEEYNMVWIKLYPFDMQKYSKLETLDDFVLGDISYNFVEDYADDGLQLLDLDVMEFRLIKMPFNTSYICANVMESNARNNGEIVLVEKNKYNFVNMNRISSTYDVDMIGKRYSRTRKKKVNSK